MPVVFCTGHSSYVFHSFSPVWNIFTLDVYKRQVSFTHYDSREQDTEGGTSNANIFYASNIMGAIYPMYVRDAQGNIMVEMCIRDRS